ncbi:MAG: hypothetical protein JXR65_02650 [Bacteroidales bacterium]|nr:hypothetical protein [Bacteroidales bacterium]
MKNFNLILIAFFAGLFWVLIPDTSFAQTTSSSKPDSYWYLNLNGGPSLFFGDIKEKKIFPATVNGVSEWRFGGGLMAGWQISPVFGLRGQGLYGQLSGVKSSANEYFQADYIEFNLNTTISINNLISGYKPGRKWDVYLMAGIGVTNYNSTSYNLTNNSIIARRGYGYGKGIGGRTLEGIAMGGLGFSYKISNHISLQLETANRIMNSDAMDTWEKNFKYDIYNYTSLGITFRFGKKHMKSQTGVKNTQTIPLLETQPQNKPKPQVQTSTLVTPPVRPDTVQQKPVQNQMVTHPNTQPEPVRTILPVKPILEYRVQIRAKYGQPISVDYLSKKYNIPAAQIRMNMHNGYYIYTVGSYDTYNQARARRDILRERNGIYDAFVVAFKNGYRLDKLPPNP